MTKIDENISPTNFSSLKELVLDEHKLVTYVSLSKDLGIHVNEAKLLLQRFVEEMKERSSNTGLNVSFIISGLSSERSAQTIVCSESDLEAKKSALITVFFHHIYSVCLGSRCVDNAALASVNKFEDFPFCGGLIKSDTCSKRSDNEIGTLKSSGQPPAGESKTVTIKKETANFQNGHKDSKSNVVKIHETKSEPVKISIKAEDSPPKSDKVSSMNGKQIIKNGNKSAKGIAGFFARSNSTPSAKPTNKTQEAVKVVVKTEMKPEMEEEIMDIEEEETVVKHIKKEPSSAKKNVTKNGNTLQNIKKNAKVDKKRKRLLHVSDSENEEENDPFADEQIVDPESDNEIPPTPTTNTVKITSGILNPKKRRKIVDKTYTDEEGYILTRKEEVYESCSDDEVTVTNNVKKEPIEIPKKEVIKEKTNTLKTEVSPKNAKSSKKVSPPQKGKQGNIMSFFKKI